MTIFYALNALFCKAHSAPAISIRTATVVFWMAEAVNTPFASFAVRILVAGIKTNPISVRIINRVWIYIAALAN